MSETPANTPAPNETQPHSNMQPPSTAPPAQTSCVTATKKNGTPSVAASTMNSALDEALKKKEALKGKGEINNKFNAFIMEHLANNGVETHFLKLIDKNESLKRS